MPEDGEMLFDGGRHVRARRGELNVTMDCVGCLGDRGEYIQRGFGSGTPENDRRLWFLLEACLTEASADDGLECVS